MHTGDLATIDAEGYCNIVGRLKDMVIRGGENIYPREVEEFLFTHPAIAEVQAFGVPDHRYGEELCVWVRRRDGSGLNEGEVIAFCRASIAHYKVPRYVRFVDSFPMTVTGKAQKYLMRKAMMEELALAEKRRPEAWAGVEVPSPGLRNFNLYERVGQRIWLGKPPQVSKRRQKATISAFTGF